MTSLVSIVFLHQGSSSSPVVCSHPILQWNPNLSVENFRSIPPGETCRMWASPHGQELLLHFFDDPVQPP
ncbi:tRNA-dihydrouridine(47) synthase [Fusarium oxysporum f. sp. albedinis]|nr:tRNA-dihydrouridine(47) synthase [Fusarium oxysporum f. sp. albedinis]